MTNGMLDLHEVLRLTLDALDAAIASDLRRTGNAEAQEAERLCRRARLRLDALAMQALKEAG